MRDGVSRKSWPGQRTLARYLEMPPSDSLRPQAIWNQVRPSVLVKVRHLLPVPDFLTMAEMTAALGVCCNAEEHLVILLLKETLMRVGALRYLCLSHMVVDWDTAWPCGARWAQLPLRPPPLSPLTPGVCPQLRWLTGGGHQ